MLPTKEKQIDDIYNQIKSMENVNYPLKIQQSSINSGECYIYESKTVKCLVKSIDFATAIYVVNRLNGENGCL